MGVFPVREGGREVGVNSVAEKFEQRGGAVQDMGVDFREGEQTRDVADKP